MSAPAPSPSKRLAQQHVEFSSAWELCQKREKSGDFAGAYASLERVRHLDDDVLGKNKWKVMGKLTELGEKSGVDGDTLIEFASAQLASAETIGSNDGMRSAYLALGRLKKGRSEHAAGAEDAFGKAAILAGQSGHLKIQSFALYSKAEMMRARGDASASDTYASALSVFQQTGDVKGVSACREKRIAVFDAAADHRRAMEESILLVQDLVGDTNSASEGARMSASYNCAVFCKKSGEVHTCLEYARMAERSAELIAGSKEERASKVHVNALYLQIQALQSLITACDVDDDPQVSETRDTDKNELAEKYMSCLRRLADLRGRLGQSDEEKANEIASFASSLRQSATKSVAPSRVTASARPLAASVYDLASEQLISNVTMRLQLKQTAAVTVYEQGEGDAHAGIGLLEGALNDFSLTSYMQTRGSASASEQHTPENIAAEPAASGAECTLLLIDMYVSIGRHEDALSRCEALVGTASTVKTWSSITPEQRQRVSKIESQAIDRQIYCMQCFGSPNRELLSVLLHAERLCRSESDFLFVKRHNYLSSIATTHAALDEVQDAERRFEEAVEANVQRGEIDEAQRLLGQYAAMLSRHGERVKAKEVAERRIALFASSSSGVGLDADASDAGPGQQAAMGSADDGVGSSTPHDGQRSGDTGQASGEGSKKAGSSDKHSKAHSEVQMLLSVAHTNNQAGDHTSSAQMLERARELARPLHDPHLDTQILTALAGSYCFVGRAPEALSIMQSIYNRKEDGESLGDQEMNVERTLATIYVVMGRYDDSMYHQQEALQLAAQSGNLVEETSVYLDMSKVYQRLRKLEQSASLVRKALQLSERSGNKDQIADANNCMANVLLEIIREEKDDGGRDGDNDGVYNEVFRHWEKALEVAVSVENCEEECCIQGNMASLYLDIGRLDDATRCSTRALELCKTLKSPSLEARIMMTRGDILFQTAPRDSSGQYSDEDAERMLDVYTQCLDLAKTANDKAIMSTLIRKVGKLYSLKKEWASAQYYYRKAYQLSREQGQTHMIASILSDLRHAEYMLSVTTKNKRSDGSMRGRTESTAQRIRSAASSISKGLRHRADRWTNATVSSRSSISSSTTEEQLRAFASLNDVENMRKILYPVERPRASSLHRRTRLFGRDVNLTDAQTHAHDSSPAATADTKPRNSNVRGGAVIFSNKVRHININAFDKEQYTALHCAAKNGCMDAVKLLVEAGANPNAETLDYESPYRLALLHAHMDVAEYLRHRAGAMPFITIEVIRILEQRRRSGPEERDYRIFGAFHRLAWNGTKSADMSDHQNEDMFGRTTMHMACYRVQIDWVKARLRGEGPGGSSLFDDASGGNLLKEDKEGWTALHWLAAAQVPSNRVARTNFSVQTIELMNILLRHEPRLIHKKTSKGETAMKLARTAGNKKLARELLRAGCREDSRLIGLLTIPLFILMMVLYGIFFPVFVISAYMRPNCKISRLMGTTPERVLRLFMKSRKHQRWKHHIAGYNSAARGGGGKAIRGAEPSIENPLALAAASTVPPSQSTGSRSSPSSQQRNEAQRDTRPVGDWIEDRWLIMIASVILAVVWAFPFAMVKYVQSNIAESKMYAWIGVWTGFIICFLCGSIYHGLQDDDIRNVRHPQQSIRFQMTRSEEDVKRKTSLLYVHTRNFMNVFRILFFFMDFAAFFNFALPADMKIIAPPDSVTSDSLNDLRTQVDRIYLLDAKFLFSHRLPFWLMTGAFICWFFLYSYMGLCLVVLRVKTMRSLFPFVRQDFYSRIPQVEIIVPFLAIVGFLPISSVCSQTLKCKYVQGTPTVSDLWQQVDSGTTWLQQNCHAPDVHAEDAIFAGLLRASANSGFNRSETMHYDWHAVTTAPLVVQSRNHTIAARNYTDGIDASSVYCPRHNNCTLAGSEPRSTLDWQAVDVFALMPSNATTESALLSIRDESALAGSNATTAQRIRFTTMGGARSITCSSYLSESCEISRLLASEGNMTAGVQQGFVNATVVTYELQRTDVDGVPRMTLANETLIDDGMMVLPVRNHKNGSAVSAATPQNLPDVVPVLSGDRVWICPNRVGQCTLYNQNQTQAFPHSAPDEIIPTVSIAPQAPPRVAGEDGSRMATSLPGRSCFETNDLPGQLSDATCDILCAATTCQRGVAACLESDRTFECWNKEHSLFAIFSMLILAYYIPTVIAVGIYFSEPDTDTGDIRLSGNYVLLEYSFKWALAGCYAYFNNFPKGQEGIITQMLALLAGITLCWSHISLKPIQDIWWLNHYRAVSFAMVAWCSLITIIATINVDGNTLIDAVAGGGKTSLPGDMILIGMASLLALYILVHLMVLIFKTKGVTKGAGRSLSISEEKPSNVKPTGSTRTGRVFGIRLGRQSPRSSTAPDANELQLTAMTPGGVHEMTPDEFKKISTDKRESVKNPLFESSSLAPSDRALVTVTEARCPGEANGGDEVSQYLSV